ncbi:MAG: SprT-like domain-containing protein [Micrococcales bacterium]|nr:SprT-like domain-containing protein [Micrococcales bacterium]
MDLSAARALGGDLMDTHGLAGWRLSFDRAKTRAGLCRYRERVISLSAYLTQLHPEDEVRDTILHEIAHALVGPRHGHDAVWQGKAREIGSTGTRCSSPDAPQVPGPWRGTCPQGHSATRHKVPTRVLLCTRCSGPAAQRVVDWTFHGEHVSMHPNYAAELKSLRTGMPVRAPGSFRPGQLVRVSAPGRYLGALGPIVKRGRTRYQVRVEDGQLSVPFAYVEAAGPGALARIRA